MERSESVRQRRGSWGKRSQKEIPSCSRVRTFLPSHSAATHSSVSAASFFFSYLWPPYLLSGPLSLSAHFSLSHTLAGCVRLSRRLHTRLQLGKIRRLPPFPRLVSIWHRASRPPRHSPVPPHSALLVTPDNWGRNPKFRNGGGGEKI